MADNKQSDSGAVIKIVLVVIVIGAILFVYQQHQAALQFRHMNHEIHRETKTANDRL